MTRFLKQLLAFLVIAGATAGIYLATTESDLGQRFGGGGRGKGGGGGGGPVPVVAEAARKADVPVYLEGVGTVRARNQVTVRPQVDGRILEITFTEGQDVKAGDVLARIDPATYKAQLDQVVARKRLTEVQLENAERDLARLTRLTTSAVAEKTVDTQRAQVAQLQAQLKADDAAIANAQATLDYTTIKAPFPGRTGLRMVDVGNLVRASDAGIVMIAEIRPIAVTFTLPQQRLAEINAAAAKGRLVVDVLDTQSRKVIDSGPLSVIDNLVDPQTGTVRLKAEVPNAALALWPGQFVNVRLLVDTLAQVVVAPTPAVQRGPSGTFVFVVKDDGTVASKPVMLGQVSDRDAVIQEGVEPGDRLVTSGFSRLHDGASVKVMAPDGERTPGGAAPVGATSAIPDARQSETRQGEAAAAVPTAEDRQRIRSERQRDRQGRSDGRGEGRDDGAGQRNGERRRDASTPGATKQN